MKTDGLDAKALCLSCSIKEIREIIREWKRSPNESFAFAALVRAQDSSYRRPGARMLISANGHTVGSLSAGCLEEEVAAAAREVICSGEARLLHFDTRRRFGCNGSIEIFVELADEEYFSHSLHA